MPLTFSAGISPISATSPSISLTAGRYDVGGEGSRYLAHSRWADSTAPETADPTIVAYADKSHNAGSLQGVDSIWAPETYRMRVRSEEHTSELQSLTNLVCRLLLEKKKNKTRRT